MRKILLIIGVLLLIYPAHSETYIYTKSYSLGGWYSSSCCHVTRSTYPDSFEEGTYYYSTSVSGCMSDDCYMCSPDCRIIADTGSANARYVSVYHKTFTSVSTNGTVHNRAIKSGYYGEYGGSGNCYCCGSEGTISIVVSSQPPSKVHGSFACVDNVTLYMKNGTEWFIAGERDESSPYSYDIFTNVSYMLVFSDGCGYEFTCNGSDIEYDYSACTYIYGYTCNINWVKLWRNNAGSWTYVDMESQPDHGLNTYVLQIESGYNYKVNFSDGHEHEFTCSGSDIEYDWDRCVWVYPPSPWQPPEIIPWYLGYDNNIVFMRDSHGNFIENAQIAVYNKNTGNYTQKWTNTPDPYILLAANNDSNDDVIVMCRTFDGVFTLETVDPAFGTDENVTWTNWTIPIMYNLEIHPTDQSNMPLHHVFVSMYEYAPFDPLAFFGYDTYWGCIPVTNCSGFSRCDIVAEKEGYRDYNVTGLNWTTKSALIKDYKQDIVLKRES